MRYCVSIPAHLEAWTPVAARSQEPTPIGPEIDRHDNNGPPEHFPASREATLSHVADHARG
jgi:hypothetical protein